MDSRNGNAAITAAAAAAASPLLQRPPALLALPELDRPPATMDLWELEAVAAALPAKKRRLRETFDRLAACSPAPIPFRWDDLDNYISSLQYSVTLRHRQLRELGMSRPVPPLPPPAPAVPSASAAAADESHQMRFLEESRAVPAPVLAPPAVSEPVANTGGEVHTLGALVKSEPVDDDPAAPSPVAVSAPAAATCVDVVESGKKRKASSHQEKETEAIDAAAARVQEEAQAAEMRKRWQGMRKRRRAARALEAQAAVIRKTREEEDAAAAAEKAAASPLQQDDMNCNGEKLIPAPPSQDTNCNGNSNNLDGHDGHAARAATPCRPGLGSGNDLPVDAVTTQMDTDPIHKITTVRHECPAATPPMVSSLWLADKVPKQEPDVEAMETVESEQRKVELPNDEVPDVEMEIVEPEEVQEDAPAVADDDNKASPPQAKPREVSPLPPLACSNGGLAQTAGARSTTATATPMNADACATVCQRSPPAGTHDAPEHVRVSGGAPKSAAVHAATIEPATRRDVSATDDHHNVSAATGREATGPSQARASPKATDKRVLQKQHMPKQGYHGRTFSSSHQNQNHSHVAHPTRVGKEHHSSPREARALLLSGVGRAARLIAGGSGDAARLGSGGRVGAARCDSLVKREATR
ncbi:hypothetical protein HU200_022666 [Digitaria exilis]|uniref:Uncharacterized protein n=1 Tax=Digitaria exilis TaxID=1010633 RepID=A0A835EXX9_9POAL|nr:hypothetical protein HU200_022666 [Digitaria exilis]